MLPLQESDPTKDCCNVSARVDISSLSSLEKSSKASTLPCDLPFIFYLTILVATLQAYRCSIDICREKGSALQSAIFCQILSFCEQRLQWLKRSFLAWHSLPRVWQINWNVKCKCYITLSASFVRFIYPPGGFAFYRPSWLLPEQHGTSHCDSLLAVPNY